MRDIFSEVKHVITSVIIPENDEASVDGKEMESFDRHKYLNDRVKTKGRRGTLLLSYS